MNKIQLKTERGKAGLVRTNIAYVLVDAAHSLLMDAETDFKAEGLVINRETKQKLRYLMDAVMVLKSRCRDFTLDAYAAKDENEVEAYCNDSDFIADFMLAAVDRSGGNPELLERIYKEIKVMPTKMHLLP